jgi:hypothetical protein
VTVATDDLRPNPVKHGGCAACGSKAESILTSGTIVAGSALKGADSAAVCSAPECMAQIRTVQR